MWIFILFAGWKEEGKLSYFYIFFFFVFCILGVIFLINYEGNKEQNELELAAQHNNLIYFLFLIDEGIKCDNELGEKALAKALYHIDDKRNMDYLMHYGARIKKLNNIDGFICYLDRNLEQGRSEKLKNQYKDIFKILIKYHGDDFKKRLMEYAEGYPERKIKYKNITRLLLDL